MSHSRSLTLCCSYSVKSYTSSNHFGELQHSEIHCQITACAESVVVMESDNNALRDIIKRLEVAKHFDATYPGKLENLTSSIVEKVDSPKLANILGEIGGCVYALLTLGKNAPELSSCKENLVNILKMCLKKRVQFVMDDIILLVAIKHCGELGVKAMLAEATCSELLSLGTAKHSIQVAETAFSCLNSLLNCTNRKLRHKLREKNMTALTELVQYLLKCGDYNLQEGMVETLTRLASQDVRSEMCQTWFKNFPQEAKDAYNSFGQDFFALETASFLQVVNTTWNTGVHPLHCIKLVLGDFDVYKPEGGVWNRLIANVSVLSESFYFAYLELQGAPDISENPISFVNISKDQIVSAIMMQTKKCNYHQLNMTLTKPLDANLNKNRNANFKEVKMILKLAEVELFQRLLGSKFQHVDTISSQVIATQESSDSNDSAAENQVKIKDAKTAKDPAFYMFKFPDDDVEVENISDDEVPAEKEKPAAKNLRTQTPVNLKSKAQNEDYSPGKSTYADYLTVIDSDPDLSDVEAQLKARKATPAPSKPKLPTNDTPVGSGADDLKHRAATPAPDLKSKRKDTPLPSIDISDNEETINEKQKVGQVYKNTPALKMKGAVPEDSPSAASIQSNEGAVVEEKNTSSKIVSGKTAKATPAPKKKGRPRKIDQPKKPVPVKGRQRKNAPKKANNAVQQKSTKQPKINIETTQEVDTAENTPAVAKKNLQVKKRKLNKAQDDEEIDITPSQLDEEVFKETSKSTAGRKSSSSELPHETFVRELALKKQDNMSMSTYPGPRKESTASNLSQLDDEIFKDASKSTAGRKSSGSELPRENFFKELALKKKDKMSVSTYSGPRKMSIASNFSEKESKFDELMEKSGTKDQRPAKVNKKKEATTKQPLSPKLFDEYHFSSDDDEPLIKKKARRKATVKKPKEKVNKKITKAVDVKENAKQNVQKQKTTQSKKCNVNTEVLSDLNKESKTADADEYGDLSAYQISENFDEWKDDFEMAESPLKAKNTDKVKVQPKKHLEEKSVRILLEEASNSASDDDCIITAVQKKQEPQRTNKRPYNFEDLYLNSDEEVDEPQAKQIASNSKMLHKENHSTFVPKAKENTADKATKIDKSKQALKSSDEPNYLAKKSNNLSKISNQSKIGLNRDTKASIFAPKAVQAKTADNSIRSDQSKQAQSTDLQSCEDSNYLANKSSILPTSRLSKIRLQVEQNSRKLEQEESADTFPKSDKSKQAQSTSAKANEKLFNYLADKSPTRTSKQSKLSLLGAQTTSEVKSSRLFSLQPTTNVDSTEKKSKNPHELKLKKFADAMKKAFEMDTEDEEPEDLVDENGLAGDSELTPQKYYPSDEDEPERPDEQLESPESPAKQLDSQSSTPTLTKASNKRKHEDDDYSQEDNKSCDESDNESLAGALDAIVYAQGIDKINPSVVTYAEKVVMLKKAFEEEEELFRNEQRKEIYFEMKKLSADFMEKRRIRLESLQRKQRLVTEMKQAFEIEFTDAQEDEDDYYEKMDELCTKFKNVGNVHLDGEKLEREMKNELAKELVARGKKLKHQFEQIQECADKWGEESS